MKTATDTKPNIAIWGSSGHALVVADAVALSQDYNLICFINNTVPVFYGTYCDKPVLGTENLWTNLQSNNVSHIIVAIGDCHSRHNIGKLVKEQGFSLTTIVHPSATIATGVKIGAGCFIAAGAVICPGTTIEENVIINTCASIDHECNIANACHISPGAHLAGNVTVGTGTWVGIGASIIEKIKIGSNTIIGAGSVVTKNIPDCVIAYGNPAKPIKKVAYI